jgi:hypothetical protein
MLHSVQIDNFFRLGNFLLGRSYWSLKLILRLSIGQKHNYGVIEMILIRDKQVLIYTMRRKANNN